jgi:hypothetical protein
MNTQPYIDRLLETENLTADLEDVEADWLIEWGIVQISSITDGLSEEGVADEQVSALLSFMRRASRAVARKDRRTPAELVEALNELGSIYAQAFGRCRLLSPAESERAATHLKELSSLEAVQFIVEWFIPI